MNQEQATGQSINKLQIIGIIAATISFVIGFWHTGKGLAYFQILGSEKGGFLFAVAILLILVGSYSKAVTGSASALFIYLVFATVTFVCNLNSFYPNYRSDTLIRQELRDHDAALLDLKEGIEKEFKDPKLETLSIEIKAMTKQLQEQIRQRGFGPRAEEDLQKIEMKLGMKIGTITRLRLGKAESEWENIALQYGKFIDEALSGVLSANRYLDKRDLIRMAVDYQSLFAVKTKVVIDTKTPLTGVPDFVEDIIKGYRETCKKAVAIGTENKKPLKICKDEYKSANAELNTFSHTFSSVFNTFFDGGTLAVLAICLFLDFIFPLAIYLLVRPKRKNEDGGWMVGGRQMPTSAR
jgi:hypothetical protein